jgi:hypothetical protein
MSDNVILLAGLFCFSLALVGLVLTVLEFRRMGKSKAVKLDGEALLRAAPRAALRT